MNKNKSFGKYKPPSITYIGYRITERCNQHCPFCFAREDSAASDQNLEDIEKFLENIKRSGITTVGIMGGEPTLRPDIVNILLLAKKNGLEVILSTNAIALDDKLLSKISPLIDYLSISLDADTAAENDKTRGDGQYDSAVRIIKKYDPKLFPFKLKVNTVVHRKNLKKGIDGIPLLFEGKPIVWKLLQFTPRLDGLKVKKAFEISLTEFNNKGESLRRRYPEVIIALRTYEINEKYDLLLLRPNGELEINFHEQYKIVGNANREEIKDVITRVWGEQNSYFNENWDEFYKSYRQI